MARSQSARTSWIVATAIFGIAFAASLTFAIYFGLQITAAAQKEKKAQDTLNQVANAAERNSAEFSRVMDNGKTGKDAKSVYGVMNADIRDLKDRINRTPDEPMEALVKDIGSAGLKEDQTLLQAYKLLSETHNADKALIEKLLAQNTIEQNNAHDQVAKTTALQETYEKSRAEFKKQLDALQQAQADLKTTSDASLANLDAQFKKELAAGAQRMGTLQTEHDQAVQNLATAQHQLYDLQQLLGARGGGAKGDPSLLPDGRVISTYADNSVVYISLGRRDRVTLGLTFEVFDSSAGVSKDETGALRGKATIEVSNVLDETSACRVVRRSEGGEIIAGDIIANAVYDPRMKFKFLVFGDFDVDGTGVPSTSDRRRIESMITQWGGKLMATPEGELPKLNYDVDFLVLGQEPPLPQPVKDKTDLGQIKEAAAAQKKYDEYEKLVSEAKVLSIPVMNQNRFLTMIGYYKR